jgi:hypothetical protein
MARSAPFGTWKSPIDSEIIAAGSTELKAVYTNASRPFPAPTSGTVRHDEEVDIFVLEGRPSENGRTAVLKISRDGHIEDVLPHKFSAASKIHEYGGGAAFVPTGSQAVIFTDGNSDGVFSLSSVEKSTTSYLETDERFKYGDFHVTAGDTILAVREEHFKDGTEVKNEIVVIDPTTKKSTVIVTGADFYSHPRFSPDGKRVAWMQWNHPDMPWTGSELYVADWKNGEKLEGKFIAGKAREQAICQPRWAWDGSLWFVNDPQGIWNLFRWDPVTGKVEEIVLKGYEDVEIGAREIKLGK